MADYSLRHRHPIHQGVPIARRTNIRLSEISAMAEFAAPGADRAMKYTVRLKTKPRRRWG